MDKIITRLILCMWLLFLSTHFTNAQWVRKDVQTDGVYGGYVEAIIASDDNLFVGTYHSGIFFTNNNGERWTMKSSGLPANITIQSLNTLGTILFAGSDGKGVFISKDSGNSWTVINNVIANICAFAGIGSNLFAGTFNGVYFSNDSGVSWTTVSSGWPSNPSVTSLATIGSILFAGFFNNQGGVYSSDDNGTTWTKHVITIDASGNTTHVNSLVANGMYLFAGTTDGVFVSSNNGTSWTNLHIPGNLNVKTLMVYGTNVFVATSSPGGYILYRSKDNGISWTAIVNSGLTNPRVLSFAVKDTSLFAGTWGGGIFRSTDTGTTWTAVNAGLSNTYVISLAAERNKIFAGIEWGGVFRSIDNGVSWASVNSGLYVNNTVYSLEVSGTDVFAGTDSGVYRSTDNGTTWNESNTGIPSITHVYVNQFASIDTNLFAGTYHGVYLSTNRGVNWTAVNSGLTDPGVMSLCVSGKYLFAGLNSGHGICLSTDNGSSWKAVNTGLPLGIQDYSVHFNINSFATIGTYVFAGTGYRVFENPAIACSTGVFLSIDTGKSWTAVNSGLSNKCVSSFAMNGTDLYAGTLGGGVFHSADSGKSWKAINSGLPDSLWVSSLSANETNLFAGTYFGGVIAPEIATNYYGIWQLPLTNTLVNKQRTFLDKQSTFKFNISNTHNPVITIQFTLLRLEKVTIKLFNLSGNEITPLVNKDFGPGSHRLMWNSRNLATGCYIARMQAGSNTCFKSVPIF